MESILLKISKHEELDSSDWYEINGVLESEGININDYPQEYQRIRKLLYILAVERLKHFTEPMLLDILGY